MLFDAEDAKPSDSPLIDKIWYVRTDRGSDFTSLAATQSGIVITRFEGQTTISIRGPETKATPASAPPDAEFIGINFKLGTFMPSLLPRNLTDRRDVHMLANSNRTFWLDCASWEIPTYENMDTFIERLTRQGLLVHDPVIGAVLEGQPQAFSPRALQYHFVRATGLPYKMIQQIERAQQALTLLKRGTSIIDTTYQLGYFDQSHLTNALKRFLGHSPSQVDLINNPGY